MDKLFGVMLDCSRNGVMTVDAVKKYASLIAKMGYNTLMLYTEDTYEIEGEPYFGHLRGRYSIAEIQEMDAFCAQIGIELVPCIQTLAHLNAIFKWDHYGDIRDCDDILLADDEKTYALLERMFASLAKSFTSRKIHIGMDEAYMVGLGRYLEKHGYQTRFDIINTHLHRVCQIAEKYGFEPMLWSDMFCKLASNTENYYSCDIDAVKAVCERAGLPENASLVYWDYYSKDYDHYVKMINLNKAFDRKVYFAGGAWTWKGFAPDNTFSMQTSEAAVRAIKDCGVDGCFFTVWGDDGNECSPFMVLPSLLYAIELVKGNTDMDAIRAKFEQITGASFDTFMLLDKFDLPGGKHNYNPSKYLLYNDPFMGLKDIYCDEADDAYYRALRAEIAQAEGKGEYRDYFDAYEKLCAVLAVKSALGIRTRALYRSGDKEGLRALAQERYTQAIEAVQEFHDAYVVYWMREKKPFGFEIQDVRLGGLAQRLKTCKQRLIDYADGKSTCIAELEEDMLPNVGNVSWGRLVSPAVISHCV